MNHCCGNTHTRKNRKALKAIKQRIGKTDLYYRKLFWLLCGEWIAELRAETGRPTGSPIYLSWWEMMVVPFSAMAMTRGGESSAQQEQL